mgnify:CR=1 FL=1
MEKKYKQIGSVGSPSSNIEIIVDVLASSTGDRLVGSMLFIESIQDGLPMRITGQVTETKMTNRYHQQDIFRSIIKTDGVIPYLSGVQDLISAQYSVGAVFTQDNGQWINDSLGNVPSSGSSVLKLEQAIVDELVEDQRDNVFQFGYAYGDKSVRLPMFLKHYGNPATGGYGEAHHTLVVGKTGSGKSTLAKMMLSGYARHEDMAMLIIDPKGEFSEELSGYRVGDSGLPFKEIMESFGRKCLRFGITQIKLETWDLFKEILGSMEFHKDLAVSGGDNAEELFNSIEEILRDSSFNLVDLSSSGVLDYVLNELIEEDNPYSVRIYKTPDPRERMIEEFKRILKNPNHRSRKTWGFIAFLFGNGSESSKRRSISSIINQIIKSESGNRPIVSIDLSVPGNKRDLYEILEGNTDFQLEIDDNKDLFTDSLQKKIIFRIVSDLRRSSETLISERSRNGDKNNVNTMVVFEEAHRFAPKHTDNSDIDGQRLTKKLIEGVRETRKYGLAWFFIDQTIGGIHKEITQQIRTLWAGFGLSMGDELERLKEIIGGDGSDMSLYQSFKDPASYSRISDKKFPWMAFGPVSPMVANRPLFINAFSGGEFIDFNQISFEKRGKTKGLDNTGKRVINKNKSNLTKGKLIKGKNSLSDLTDDDLTIFLD